MAIANSRDHTRLSRARSAHTIPHSTSRICAPRSVDSFNRYENNKAAKMHSVCATSHVCLKLLPGIHYRTEHIYLAATALGHHDLELQQPNHFLRTSFALLETTSAASRHSYVEMCSSWCATLPPFHYNLFWLRFPDHSSTKHFSSFRQLAEDLISNIRPSRRPQRTGAGDQAYAKEWKGTLSDMDHEEYFRRHGFRWSKVVPSLYWDPTHFADLDAVHNCSQGDLLHRCHNLSHVDIRDKENDPANTTPHSRRHRSSPSPTRGVSGVHLRMSSPATWSAIQCYTRSTAVVNTSGYTCLNS